jgi:hypothetical protein
MMNSRLATTLLFTGSALFACGPSLKIYGRVVACEDQKPIPSAEVRYSYHGAVGASAQEEQTKTTSKDGTFTLGSLNFSENTMVEVHIEAKDRQPFDDTYRGSQKEEQVICLKKK